MTQNMQDMQDTRATRSGKKRSRHLPALAVGTAALLVAMPVAPAAAQSGCGFVFGFGALKNLLPQVVGNCVWDEMHRTNGDATQVTDKGLLTWRKATGFTAFTDGKDIHVLRPGNTVDSQISGPATDLRLALSQLLSEHADLALVAMQKGLDGSPDFPVVAAQLDKNSVALSQAIASVYGEAAGRAFLDQWRDHIRMFVDYTVATAKNDQAGRAKARAELDGYRDSFAKFLNSANPNLPVDAVAGLLQEHVNQLAGALDAYAAKDHAKAYAMLHDSHNHMFMTANALAGGIAKQSPEKFPGSTTTKAAELHAALDALLSEHSDIAAVAMQKGLDGKPDFGAIAAQLDMNSVALADAVGSVYGPAARDAFLTQWRDHIRMFVDYTVATAKKDEAGRAKALGELNGYKDSFSKFLQTANPNVPADAAAMLLQEHVNQLAKALDAYSAKDYATAYALLSQSHGHMFQTGGALAGGIVKQTPENFVG
jgi:hypothetical protein